MKKKESIPSERSIISIISTVKNQTLSLIWPKQISLGRKDLKLYKKLQLPKRPSMIIAHPTYVTPFISTQRYARFHAPTSPTPHPPATTPSPSPPHTTNTNHTSNINITESPPSQSTFFPPINFMSHILLHHRLSFFSLSVMVRYSSLASPCHSVPEGARFREQRLEIGREGSLWHVDQIPTRPFCLPFCPRVRSLVCLSLLICCSLIYLPCLSALSCLSESVCPTIYGNTSC